MASNVELTIDTLNGAKLLGVPGGLPVKGNTI